jgi:magnesium chelatase subunit D
MSGSTYEDARWRDAVLAAAILSVEPHLVGGVALRAAPGLWRDRWLALLRSLLPASQPIRRLPLHTSEERLLGGIDLAASLNAGRPIASQGMLSETHSGILIAATAERLDRTTAAHLSATLDCGELTLERDGISTRKEARIGVVALDEGIEDERPPTALLERLAIHLDLNGIAYVADDEPYSPCDVIAARQGLSTLTCTEEDIIALCHGAAAFGIAGTRTPLNALRIARISAALGGRSAISATDLAVAGRLVLAPRATMVPAQAEEMPAENAKPDDQHRDATSTDGGSGTETTHAAQDVVIEAVKAALPPNILDKIRSDRAQRRSLSGGRAGQQRKSPRRGRPVGVRPGDPRHGARLDLVETMRAAVPWQTLRRRKPEGAKAVPIEVRRSDFRVKRFKHRAETMTIFVVDASGSSALHRLGEAKGAIGHLLADCYTRRDHVALIAFRGHEAEIVLPPTRSLTRAKRCLAALPGGGGTPLAAAIEAAAALAEAAERKGQTPIIVFMTDGRANVARDGEPDRKRAEEDSLVAARLSRERAFAALLIDTSPRPRSFAGKLAETLGANYLPLPSADAGTLSTTVRTAKETVPGNNVA